ncbi:hypothetical protein JCM8547_002791 [Rhodosporidiobolus lusitaniae]
MKRILPVEVQHLILQYLVKSPARATLPLLPRRPPSSARFSSTASLSSSDLFSHSAASSTTPAASAAPPLSVFEEPTDEYDAVPLSTLDHPAPSRSPDRLLVSLLQSTSPSSAAEALSLLHEVQSCSQPILPRYYFAKHALSLARKDLRDPAWFEWWKLAPSVMSSDGDMVQLRETASAHLYKAERRMENAAREIVKDLIEEARRGRGALNRVEEFAMVLVKQGQARVVAEEVLRHVAAYGLLEMGERLFEATFDSLRTQSSLAPPPERSERRSFRLTARRRRRMMTKSSVEARKAARFQRWLYNRTKESHRALLLARADMILAHANLARLDTAVQLVHLSQQLPSLVPGAFVRLNHNMFLKLLDLASRLNRFDLFETLYDSVHSTGRQLVRVRNAALRVPTPYFIRSAKGATAVAAESARDVFTSFRYRYVGSSLKDSPFEPSSVPFDAEEHAAAFGAPPSPEQLERLQAHIDADEFTASFRSMLELLSKGQLPPAPTSAAWLAYAQSKGEDPHFVQQGLDYLDGVVEHDSKRRGYWTTVKMLERVQAEDYLAAYETYATHFDLAAVPMQLRAALRGEARFLGRFKGRRKLPPSAYTFAVVVQAVVAQLQRHVETATARSSTSPSALNGAGGPPGEITLAASRAAGQINASYKALLTSPRFDIVPSFRHSSPTSTSLLSPYTFTPFLLFHLYQRRPPLFLLSLLADLTSLSLQPPLAHYAIVLNSFARFGDSPSKTHPPNPYGSDDLLYLLDVFSSPSRPPSSSQLARKASPALVTLLESSSIALPTTPLNAEVYSGVLAGLRKRGERETALKVLDGVVADRAEEVKKWGVEDRKFRREVVLLTQAAKGKE